MGHWCMQIEGKTINRDWESNKRGIWPTQQLSHYNISIATWFMFISGQEQVVVGMQENPEGEGEGECPDRF